ncbi:MAG: cupin domain-containing protein [Gammaproteobacteria bacterium]|jgi:quercetin dioxygenase-like cupin family protein
MSTAPKRETRVETLKDLLHCQDKAVVSRMLVKNEGGSVTMFAFDRGEGLSEHTAPYDALLVGIEGEADVRIAGVTHRLGEGQTVLIPATAPHSVDPASPFKMLLVMIRGEAPASAS